MKFVRPTVIGCLAFLLTFALLLFFSSTFLNALQPTIQTGVAALPPHVAVAPTPNPSASSTAGADVNVINSATPQGNGDDMIPDVTAAPTDIPDVSPPP